MDVIYCIPSLRGRIVARHRRVILVWWRRRVYPICKALFSFPHPTLNSGGSWASGVPESPPLFDTSFSPALSVSPRLPTENIFKSGGYWNNPWDSHWGPQKMTAPISLRLQEGIVYLCATFPTVLGLCCWIAIWIRCIRVVWILKHSLTWAGDRVPQRRSGLPCPPRHGSCWEAFAVTGTGAGVDVRR